MGGEWLEIRHYVPLGCFLMHAKLFSGTPWMPKKGVLKTVWAIRKCMVSIATHNAILKNWGVPTTSIISYYLSKTTKFGIKVELRQTKLYLELKFSSMLGIFLRHCFKIVFEIFHVMGRWPLFQINYIDWLDTCLLSQGHLSFCLTCIFTNINENNRNKRRKN